MSKVKTQQWNLTSHNNNNYYHYDNDYLAVESNFRYQLLKIKLFDCVPELFS